MRFLLMSKTGFVAATCVLALFCVHSLRADDSQWFAIPENASFEQLRDFAGRLNEELRKRNKEHFDKYQAGQLTQEENEVVQKFRDQCEKTGKEITNLVEALPQQSKESKEFVLQRKWNVARRNPYIQQRVAELKNLLARCENDPDLAGMRKQIYGDWFGYALMDASSLDKLDQLFEELLVFLKEDEANAIYKCDGYFKKLFELKPDNVQEKMDNSLGKIMEIVKDTQNDRVKSYLPKIEGSVRFYQLPGNEMELEGILPDGSKFNIKDFHGKPVVACFYKTYPIPDLPPGVIVNRQTPLASLLKKLKSFDTRYASKDLGIVVYLVGKENQDFPAPDDTMKDWKIISAEDSVAGGMKNYWDYYGLQTTPTWFLVDRDGNVVDTGNDFDQALDGLMEGK